MERISSFGNMGASVSQALIHPCGITALLSPAARPRCQAEEPEALRPVLMFVSHGGKGTR
jgi:hypothetical protein